MAEVQREGMYLVLPVPFRVVNGEYFVEAQAANGLDRWADHFERLVVAAPVIPEEMVARLSGFVWRSLSTLEHRTRPLPANLFLAPLPGLRSRADFAPALDRRAFRVTAFRRLIPLRGRGAEYSIPRRARFASLHPE